MKFHYDLTVIKNKVGLLGFLGVSEEQFSAVYEFQPIEMMRDPAEVIVIPSETPFFQHTIPKRDPTRGSRIVWEASEPYKDAYKAVARRLDTFL